MTHTIVQALSSGNQGVARIHAGNVIRKQKESLNMLRLSSRVDAAAGRVQTAVTMRTVTTGMRNVVGSMGRAMDNMNTEQVRTLTYYYSHHVS